MGQKRKDYNNEIGKRYGRLIFKEMTDEKKHGRYCGRFICDCGNELISIPALVFRGNTQSCGCYKRELQKSEWLTWKKHRKDYDKEARKNSKSGVKNIRAVKLKSGEESYQVRVVRDRIVSTKTFSTLDDAITWRDSVYASDDPSRHVEPDRENDKMYRNIKRVPCEDGSIEYRVRLKRNKRDYAKAFKSLEKAMAWRDDIIKRSKEGSLR